MPTILKSEKFAAKENNFFKRLALAGLLLSGANCAATDLKVDPKPTAAGVADMVLKERNGAMARALKQLGGFERPGWHIDGGVISCTSADDEEKAKEKAKETVLKEVEKAGIELGLYTLTNETRFAVEKMTKGYTACAQSIIKK